MKKEEMETIINNMQNKLGEENASIIGDDLATILSDNSNMLDEIDKRNNEISVLKKDKENLIVANGNLFKQVAIGVEEKEDTEKPREKFSYKKAFDEKGNFI